MVVKGYTVADGLIKTDDITNYRVGVTDGTTNGAGVKCVKTFQNANFQVSTGKNFVIEAFKWGGSNTSNLSPTQGFIGYADDAAGTNFVSFTDVTPFVILTGSIMQIEIVKPEWVVPSGKFLVMKQTGTYYWTPGVVRFYGWEVDA